MKLAGQLTGALSRKHVRGRDAGGVGSVGGVRWRRSAQEVEPSWISALDRRNGRLTTDGIQAGHAD